MAISKERMDERYPLWKLTKGLTALIKRAHEFKKKEFQDDADELMEFFTGTCNIFGNDATDKKRGYMSGDREVPVPDFQMKLLKINEGEQLIGPALYANNPQTN